MAHIALLDVLQAPQGSLRRGPIIGCACFGLFQGGSVVSGSGPMIASVEASIAFSHKTGEIRRGLGHP
ncbi:hypothetical protein P8R33_09300 [Qipengyuania sp. XHP0211]|uniref:hypothetical protein n=1 Tax=Qipengyuania sp. XHP0211 TaxID=3038079 RepID=UPI00241BFFC1|nr:hypothetical protein [Qipengyuania sp. XHP0211]MDG5751300.1 hypothetical protein [Qipengyuania sp. XHP0211]